MEHPTYTMKEVLDIQLRALNEGVLKLDKTFNNELTEVKELIKAQNLEIEKRAHVNDTKFANLDKDIKELRAEVQGLKEQNEKYKVIWGIGATAGASLVAFFLNRIF